MGSLAFDKEYLVTPRSDTSSLFPYELFSDNFDPGETLLKKYDSREFARPWLVVTGWDFAIGLSGDTDYNVGFTIGMDSEGERHLLNIDRVRHLPSYQDIIARIKDNVKRYGPALVILETVAFQDIYLQALKGKIGGRSVVEGHKTGREKVDLKDGVPGLRILLENKRYHIPRGDNRSVELTDTWISECSAFGWQGDKLGGVGEHDDTVMAWWFAELALSRVTDRPRRGAGIIATGASRQ